MDGFGIGLFILGAMLYFAFRGRYGIFAWLSGVGAGIFIGSIWAYLIVSGAIDAFLR